MAATPRGQHRCSWRQCTVTSTIAKGRPAASVSAALVFVLLFALAPRAFAQVDLAGEWGALNGVSEDQPHRVPGPTLGDYTGLPINDAARLKARSWDASVLSQPERQAQPHPAEYAEHTWDGFSTGEWVGAALKVTTTHMKWGVIQRNGVPASPNATMVEFW